MNQALNGSGFSGRDVSGDVLLPTQNMFCSLLEEHGSRPDAQNVPTFPTGEWPRPMCTGSVFIILPLARPLNIADVLFQNTLSPISCLCEDALGRRPLSLTTGVTRRNVPEQLWNVQNSDPFRGAWVVCWQSTTNMVVSSYSRSWWLWNFCFPHFFSLVLSLSDVFASQDQDFHYKQLNNITVSF